MLSRDLFSIYFNMETAECGYHKAETNLLC